MRTRPRVEIGSSHADSDSNNCPGSSAQYELGDFLRHVRPPVLVLEE